MQSATLVPLAWQSPRASTLQSLRLNECTLGDCAVIELARALTANIEIGGKTKPAFLANLQHAWDLSWAGARVKVAELNGAQSEGEHSPVLLAAY